MPKKWFIEPGIFVLSVLGTFAISTSIYRNKKMNPMVLRTHRTFLINWTQTPNIVLQVIVRCQYTVREHYNHQI